jgi:predicted nuclease of predicted toxin-antitoxin system
VKLLFDENLSFRLVPALTDIYPGSAHVRDAGLLGAEDGAIWSYAAERGFLLTSKDTDFYERSVLFGAPPKVIWLRIGNRTVADTGGILRAQYIRIRRFHEDPQATFLPVRHT